jgi:diketogulonate reductase-like aldo/keto reductase
MSDQPTVTLTSGARMPQLGYGVFKVPRDQTAAAVSAALETGYRSIDTAAMYGNEAGVGVAIAASGSPRDELFITTKLNNDAHGYDSALQAFEDSRKALGLDYVDLYLIHWPQPRLDRYVQTWRALVTLQADGLARSIGVSNFQPAQLRRVIEDSGVTPALNQIELHPYLTQAELRAVDAEHGIATEAWSPLARGGALLHDPLLTGLAEKYGKTAAQVVLRWHVELGNVVIPKSVTPARIAENFAIFDFELSADDREAISGLNRGERTGPNPDEMG